MEVCGFVWPGLESARVVRADCGERRAGSYARVEWARRRGVRTETFRDVEAAERGPGSRRAAAAAAEEQQPFPALAGGRMAAAEQDGAHVRRRGRRGHAGGLLRRGAPLSALLPGREGRGAARIPPEPSSPCWGGRGYPPGGRLGSGPGRTSRVTKITLHVEAGSGNDGAGAAPQRAANTAMLGSSGIWRHFLNRG